MKLNSKIAQFVNNSFEDISSLSKCLISLLVALILGINIYYRSDFPPYGYPFNELSDNYWGLCIDVAHRWRALDFTFWNRGIGGGMSLFSSGQYALLNPTNALAWIFNDEQFFLIKLIEPYVLGVFFMMLLLWEGFKARWYVAMMGGFLYMGLIFSRSTTMVESPVFLFGISLLPLMVFILTKYIDNNMNLVALGVGGVLAIQFLGEGVSQLPQMMAWWCIFFTIFFLFDNFGKVAFIFKFKKWLMAIGIFVFVTIGLSAVQLFPTCFYYKNESARLYGMYPINNFPLWGTPVDGTNSLMQTFYKCLVDTGPVKVKIIVVLILMCLALCFNNWGKIFIQNKHRRIVFLTWATTIVYLILPSMADSLVGMIPSLKWLFIGLSSINFRYGLHTLDLCLVLSLCLILNNELLTLRIQRKKRWMNPFSFCCLILALFVGILSLMLTIFPGFEEKLSSIPWLMSSKAATLSKAAMVFLHSIILIYVLSMRPTGIIASYFLFLFYCLLVL